MNVRFRALSDGITEATYGEGDKATTWLLEVRGGAIIEGGINFEGWKSIQASSLVFLGALVVLCASGMIRLLRASWYGYTMVALGAGLLFFGFVFAFQAFVWVTDASPSLRFFLMDVAEMVDFFAALSLYFMLPLSLAVSISNLSLIRHEGRRPVNLLGIAASVVWLIVYLIPLFSLYKPASAESFLLSLLSVAMVYGECLLLSTMLCAWLASRHVPAQDMDYLVILGCGIRPDGTPCPLLAGRIDKAVEFDRRHAAAGGSPAVFVPSGGQGPDEPVSEAQSMAGYLVEQRGIGPERIALEDRSTTTRENMAFSREVIERHAGRDANELRIGFSTTNYHVFRGYVCAHHAGMAVEGMGSKTKWYFWPNAFLREFVGLVVTRWLDILIGFVVMATVCQLVTYVLSLAVG